MSLIIPDSFKHYVLVGIDPGLNTTGISKFIIDFYTNNILHIEAFTITNDKLLDTTSLYDNIYSDRLLKLYKLKEALTRIVSIINPCLIACESPFYNRFRPMAYGSLLETVRIIHSAVMEYNINIPFTMVEPLLVKKVIGAGMMKGKVDVKLAVNNRPELISVLTNDINTLDEHSIDAIAVGYAYYNKYIVNQRNSLS